MLQLNSKPEKVRSRSYRVGKNDLSNKWASATTITHIEFICFEDGVLLMTMQAFEIPISVHIASCTTGPHLNLGPMNISHMGV